MFNSNFAQIECPTTKCTYNPKKFIVIHIIVGFQMEMLLYLQPMMKDGISEYLP